MCVLYVWVVYSYLLYTGTVFGHATFSWTRARKKAGTRPRKKKIKKIITFAKRVSQERKVLLL